MSAQKCTIKVRFLLTEGILDALGVKGNFARLFLGGRTKEDPLGHVLVYPGGVNVELRYSPYPCEVVLYGLADQLPLGLLEAEGFEIVEVVLEDKIAQAASRNLLIGKWVSLNTVPNWPAIRSMVVDLEPAAPNNNFYSYYVVEIRGANLDQVRALYETLRTGKLIHGPDSAYTETGETNE